MKLVSSVVLLTLIILANHGRLKSQANNSHNGFALVDGAGNIRKPSFGVKTPNRIRLRMRRFPIWSDFLWSRRRKKKEISMAKEARKI